MAKHTIEHFSVCYDNDTILVLNPLDVMCIRPLSIDEQISWLMVGSQLFDVLINHRFLKLKIVNFGWIT